MAGNVKFKVYGEQTNGQIIDNKQSTINQWDFRGYWMQEHPEGEYLGIHPFVEYMQFMTATGGNKNRDLFKDPMNFDVMDDYDFEPLVTACKTVLQQGMIPFIKTGNVPLKYSAYQPEFHEFGVNVYAPKDYQVYYDYIKALAVRLVEVFGLEEVQGWRWGVFTEYENADWFIGDPTRKSACEAYCKLYDYTVGALISVLGEDIYVGAHSMTNGEGSFGLWDEEDFIKHCALGPNYENGSSSTKLSYLAVSFYETTPDERSARPMLECIRIVRECAESYGLKLDYGIDEGRILYGSDHLPLVSRVVGQIFQAGMDAHILKEMLDNDISWFATWTYTAQDCLPTVSYHVAQCFHKLVGSEQVTYEKVASDVTEDIKVDLITGCDKDNKKYYVMGYCYKHELAYDGLIDLHCSVDVPLLAGDASEVKVTTYLVDDNCNYYPKWRADLGEVENTTGWSIDSANPLLPVDADKYRPYSVLEPKTVVCNLQDGAVELCTQLKGNEVVLYVIERV